MNAQQKGLAWTAAVALFMQSLDSTILNTALPVMSASLHESPLQMELAIISYALTVAALIPLSGWLADRLGTLRVFRLAVMVFVLGSVACAMAPTLDWLVAARILQGVGGALMMPVARLAIIRTVPKSELVAAWNLMAMTGLVGPIVGPILGGWLAVNLSWHWIFFINIPIGLAGILISGRYMPNVRMETQPLDWKGFLLFAGGLVGLTYGLELAAESLGNAARALAVMAAGAAAMCLYALYARRSANPLLPLSLFRVHTFRIGLAANLMFRLLASGIPFLVPLMLQVAFGYNAEMAGWMLAPVALSSIVMKPFTAPILVRFGYKNTLLGTALAMSLIVASLGLLDSGSSITFYMLLAGAYGLCQSLMFTAINTLTIGDLSDAEASAGSTMLSMVQQVGIGIGIAVAAVVLGVYRAAVGESGALLERAFSHTYVSLSVCGVVLLWLLSKLHSGDGGHLSGRKGG
ncbi:MFS transporter [Eikenella longinqua]|uniref:MFS transporter n=1 Tax=Eikenella longinqua TaxID=1795827 RepID=A0A1A9RXE5_9NEIS|nr:DHA2 family efflux MFS transporter permease subunit [Eikenella longinqua]OAM29401.1 MFS transporter [Eikenella longinqua]